MMFKGRDITGATPADVPRLGMARSFRISAVFPRLTAPENMRVALQRALEITATLALDPAMMRLDEPAAGMAVRIRNRRRTAIVR
jgi:branched-chain amino acid transport system ATP-binding protein